MCKDVNARFTTVPMKALSDQVCIRYHPHVHSIRLFSVVVSLQKWQVHFSSYKNHIIFHIFDEIRISRVSLYTGHCYLCMEGRQKLCLQSLKGKQQISKYVIFYLSMFIGWTRLKLNQTKKIGSVSISYIICYNCICHGYLLQIIQH